eukprot:SAG11_NODE_19793_length_458_cov_3.311978_1_plen_37_part_10
MFGNYSMQNQPVVRFGLIITSYWVGRISCVCPNYCGL